MAKLNITKIQDAFHDELMTRRDSSGKLEFLSMFGVVAGALRNGLKKNGKKPTTIVSFENIATAAAGIALRKENEKTLATMVAADKKQKSNNLNRYSLAVDAGYKTLESAFEEVADDAAVLEAYTNFIGSINGKTFRDNGDRGVDIEFVCDIKLPEFDENDE